MSGKNKKHKKAKARKLRRKNASTALMVVSELHLTSRQNAILSAPTPPEFVRERPIRSGGKGKTAKYVEVGYVQAKLNEAFGQLNWNWEILERGETSRKLDKTAEGEVWVKGRLTVLDHKKGYKIFKDAFGQHPIYPGTPYGDALKSAGSDALKKAAAQGFGVAMDIYWTQLEQEPAGEKTKEEKQVEKRQEKTETQEEMFAKAKKMILACHDHATLVVWRGKIHGSKNYSNPQKVELMSLINEKVNSKK